LLGGRKLGGILVEASGRRCVVGIGINLSWAPPGAARLETDRELLLDRLLAELERSWMVAGAELLDAWRARSDTLGRRVRVELGQETFEGIAEDLAQDGSLIVGGRVVAAGDVTLLRVAEPRPGAPGAPRPTSRG